VVAGGLFTDVLLVTTVGTTVEVCVSSTPVFTSLSFRMIFFNFEGFLALGFSRSFPLR